MAQKNTSLYRFEDVDLDALDANTLLAIAEHYGFPEMGITYPGDVMRLNIAGTREAWEHAVFILERDNLLDLAFLILDELFGEPTSEPTSEPTPEWLRTHPLTMNIGYLSDGIAPDVPIKLTAPMKEPPLPTGEYQVELTAVERSGAFKQYVRWTFRVVGDDHTLIYHTDYSNSISSECLKLASMLLGRNIQHGEEINLRTLVGKTAIAVVRYCKHGKHKYNSLEKLKPDTFRWTGDLTD